MIHAPTLTNIFQVTVLVETKQCCDSAHGERSVSSKVSTQKLPQFRLRPKEIDIQKAREGSLPKVLVLTHDDKDHFLPG